MGRRTKRANPDPPPRVVPEWRRAELRAMEERAKKSMAVAKARAAREKWAVGYGVGYVQRGRSADDWTPVFDCYIGRETAKAFQIHQGGDTFWLPKKLIRNADGLRRHTGGVTIEVPEWFALRIEII